MGARPGGQGRGELLWPSHCLMPRRPAALPSTPAAPFAKHFLQTGRAGGRAGEAGMPGGGSRAADPGFTPDEAAVPLARSTGRVKHHHFPISSADGFSGGRFRMAASATGEDIRLRLTITKLL